MAQSLIGEMTPLRIVLLGKSASENNRVRNSIVEVKGRCMTLINCPHLLQTNISDDQITQMLRECVSLSDPGPHVFILTLQYRDFTEEDMRRVKYVLNKFSEEAMRRTIIITTDKRPFRSRMSFRNNAVHQLMKECGGGHLKFKETKPELSSEVFNRVYEILKENQEQYLTCEIIHDVKESSVSEEQSRTKEEKSNTSPYKYGGRANERKKEEDDHVSANSSKKLKLSLVLCGSDTTLIESVSKLLRGKNIHSSHERAVSKVCVKKEAKIDGRLLSLVELPALSRLSEEEVMRQTLRCLTLCDPGVHAFIIVTVCPLNNDEKSEIEKILKIFDSKEHFMLHFTSDFTFNKQVTEFVKNSSESQSLIRRCGGQYRVIGLKEPENTRLISDLLDYIENMKTEPYSLQMYVKAQENRVRQETEEKYEEKVTRMEDKIKELQQKIQSEDAVDQADDLKCLRIVLIGKTGNGKSATGNTILGREEFVSEASMDSVTTVCEKRVGEIDGRSVAVVDTPGLFDTKLSRDQAVEEIIKCVSLSSPGPHVFLIVLSVGRFTKEESDTLDLIKKIFGPKAAQFSIVLFTRGDGLGNKSIQDYVDRSNNEEPKKLIRDCGNRFLVFNNREKQDRTQVTQLLKMIEEVKNTNQGRYFTNSMFEEAEMSIKKRMEEILKEKEREIQKEREELQDRYEIEMKNMMKRLEEEKQRADEERMKIENQFREKEEKLRKEFEEKEKTEQIKRETENQKRLEEEKQQRAEFNRKIEELKTETENQKSEFKQQQREEDQKREHKYKEDKEKMRNEMECIIAELQRTQQEERRKRDYDEIKRKKEEQEERQRWEKKLKEAENERNEIQEEIKRQQREWEDEIKQQMREREEEERKRKEKYEERLREKQEEMEKMRMRFEMEREKERQKIEEERLKQRREREEREREYEEKKNYIKIYYDLLEQERKEEWERRKRINEERREEDRRRWKKMIEVLKQERDEEMKKRERDEKKIKEKEERVRDELKKKHEEEIKEMKMKHEDQARKQAEEFNVFRERNEENNREIQQMLEEHQKRYEYLENIYQCWKDEKREELKNLKVEIKDLKKKQCTVM